MVVSPERTWSFGIVTLGGEMLTMFAGEPLAGVTVSCTVIAALATSQSPQPGVFVSTERVCGALRVVRVAGIAKPPLTTKKKVGVTTSISTLPSAQPVAEAVMVAGTVVGATPDIRNSAEVSPAGTVMLGTAVSLVGSELAKATVRADVT